MKMFPPAMVTTVTNLYLGGMTQKEIANELGETQKVIWKLMRNHGIQTRPKIKRNQSGERNDSWKGSDAKYAALHLRVAVARGKPSLCEDCGTTSSPRFEWTSISKKYDDVNDYRRLCCSCHHKMDGHARNLGAHAKKKEV